MRNDKIRRFRPRMNKYRSRRPNNGMNNNGVIHQVNVQRNGFLRNNVSRNPHNLEKIIEKALNWHNNISNPDMNDIKNTMHLTENYIESLSI